MKKESIDLVQLIQDLVTFREQIWPSYEKELQMWRTKYIDSVGVIQNQEIVKKYFLIAHPDHVLKNGPLSCVGDIEKLLSGENNENKPT